MSQGLFIGDDSTYEQDQIPAIWTIDIDDEAEVLAWDKRARDILREGARAKNWRTKNHLLAYRGFYQTNEPVVGGKGMLEIPKKTQFPKIIVNHFQDLVEQKIANQLKYKPNFDVIPDSLELKDKQDSIMVKKLLDSNNYWSGLPKKYHKILRHAVLSGNGWVIPYWNKWIGDETGEVENFTLTLKNDTRASFSTPKRKGEISYKLAYDWEVYLFPAEYEEDVPGFCWEHIVPTDELRLQYPEREEDIVPTKDISTFSNLQGDTGETFGDMIKNDHTIVRNYYFRSSKAYPNGLYFSCTEETWLDEPTDLDIPAGMLENDPLGNLPVARLTDVDLEGEINGYPSTAFIYHLCHVYDKWFSLCHKNIFMFCHPKWTYQAGSVDESRLASGSFLLPYKSPNAPQLQVYQALTQDLLRFGELILTSLEKVMRIYGVSRGAPPPGTRAAASLYFYDEQEQTANSIFRRKFEDFVTRIETLKLALMSKYYSKDKTRIVQIIGRDQQWLAEAVDLAALSKKYTVRIKSASNLPDSKYQRIQALLDVASQFKNQQTEEQILEELDFGQQEKFIDDGRKASMAAEAENEMLMADKEIPPPEPFELQITHWKAHNKLAQDPSYKKQEPDTRRRIEEHIGAHEMIMISLGENNPVFKQQLMAIPQFPLYAPLPPMAPQAGPVQGGPSQEPALPQVNNQGIAQALGGENPDMQQNPMA